MTEFEMEQIVETVTQQVLLALRTEKGGDSEKKDAGTEKLLVIGEPGRVPESLRRYRDICSLAGCRNMGDTFPCCAVLIETLTFSQLADIAQGRDSDEVSRAVLRALLSGTEVALLETALPHRRYARKGSHGLYQLLENYVQTLQSFGVKLLCGAEMSVNRQVPTRSSSLKKTYLGSRSLITEAEALRLVQEEKNHIRLPSDAIVTPAAQDVFTRARIRIDRGG